MNRKLNSMWCFLVAVTVMPISCQGSVMVDMYQIDDGPRAVGSTIQVVSNITNITSNAFVSITLWARKPNNSTPINLGSYLISANGMPDSFVPTDNLKFLNLSVSTPAMNARKITWEFYCLLPEYNRLQLSTNLTVNQQNVADNSILTVSACPSPTTIDIYGQNSTFNITAKTTSLTCAPLDDTITTDSGGYYNNFGTCKCNGDEYLYYDNGTEANDVATCGLYAEWIGCGSSQCWSPPRNITVEQLNHTASARNPFNCFFSESFPVPSFKYRIDDHDIRDDYSLNWKDNGKNLFCKVISKFPTTETDGFISLPVELKVYYSPQNSSLSDSSPVIQINESRLLNYSFFVNARGNFEVTIDGQPWSAYYGPFTSKRNISDNTLQPIFVFEVLIKSGEYYRDYLFCSSTDDPPGTECITLTIRNVTATTPWQGTTTYSMTTGSKELAEMSTLVISLIVVGVVLLMVILAFIVYCIRRKNARRKENGREEKLNELYGSAPTQGIHMAGDSETIRQETVNVLYVSAPNEANTDIEEYATANPECVVNTGVNQYSMSNPDATNEEQAGHDQPTCSSNVPVYAHVDLSHRKKGKKNDGFKGDNEGNPNTSSDMYAAIDKSKKRDKKEPAGDVYSIVNKSGM